MNRKDSSDKPESSFGGFFEGYSTGKLSSNEGGVYFHINESISIFKSIYEIINKSKNIYKQEEEIKSLLFNIIDLLSKSDDLMFKSEALGEALKTLLCQYGTVLIQNRELFEKVKPLVFHYVNIAKQSKSPKLIQLALFIDKLL